MGGLFLSVREKCYALCISGDRSKIRSGHYTVNTVGGKVLEVRLGFRKRLSAVIREGVKGVPFKRNRLLWLVDVEKREAIKVGESEGVVDGKVDGMLSLMLRDKFWKFIGSRAFDWFEMLIMLGAGYGFFRLVEIFLSGLFAGG